MYLTLFDLDHTLLAGDSDYEWGRFLVREGVVDRDHYLRENDRFHEQYQAGTLDIHAFQRFVLASLRDNPLAQMLEVRRRYIETRIKPLIARQAPDLIAHHRNRGDTLAIITATNRFITEPIAQMLEVTHLMATEPEIVDGRYTGEIVGTPTFQEGKIARVKAWIDAQSHVFDHVTFYSDSHNDLPLLRWADRAVAVDPDPQLAVAAQEAGWPVISLRGETRPF